MQLDFKNPKTYLIAALGAAIVFVVGQYLLPVVNALLKFIPQYQLYFNGLTPHVIVAYGIALLVAMYVQYLIFKN